MKILLINGAHRRSGMTCDLVDLFTSGCEEAGATVDRVDLHDCDIKYCQGCFSCYAGPNPGQCVISDDMQGLYAKFKQSDTLVMSTPVYFYTMSSRLKTFLERMFPLTSPRPEYYPADGLIHNGLRDPVNGPKKFVLIAAFAHRSMESIEGMVATMEKVAWALGAVPVGNLLRPESPFMDFEASKPRTVKKVRAAFRSAGRELVEKGVIGETLIKQASVPVTSTPKMFADHFEKYFEILNEHGIVGGNRKAIQDIAATDLRILMPEFAESFDPKAAGKLDRKILFDLVGPDSQQWFLHIADAECRMGKGPIDDPDLVIESTADTIADLMLARLDVKRALVQKEIRLFGDKRLFTQLGKLFPPRPV